MTYLLIDHETNRMTYMSNNLRIF